MTSLRFDPKLLETLFRSDRILAGGEGFDHPEFKIMSGTTSLQIYSKRLMRVVFLFRKEGTDLRVLSSYKMESDNQEELDRIVRLMRGLMVLDDMAEIKNTD